MNKVLTGLCLILLASCSSTVDFKVQGSRFHTPESAGEALKPGVTFGYGVGHKYELAEISSGIIFDDTYEADVSTAIEKTSGVTLHAFLGMTEYLDIYYNTYHDSVDTLGVKWQLIGDSLSKGHKLALLAGYGLGTDTSAGDIKLQTDSSSSRSYDTELELSAFDLELIYGYRASENALVYANLNYSDLSAEAELTSSDFDDEEIEGSVKTQALLLGVEFRDDKKQKGIMLEVGVSKSEWENSVEKTIYPVGAAGYFRF